MNITTFGQDLKNMTPNGFCLNPEERVHLGLAITQLKVEMGLEEAYFWGKIEGKYTHDDSGRWTTRVDCN